MTHQTLYATVVKLIAAADGTLPATQGRLAHGAFFDIIRRVEPGLADHLHNLDGRKPFTVSPLNGGRLKKKELTVRRGWEVWLRFTLLGSDLFAAFTRYLLAPPAGRGGGAVTLHLGDHAFTISEMLTTPGSHRWAGYTSLETVWQRWQSAPLPAGKAAGEIEMEFASPTVFSLGSRNGLGKYMEPFPHPAIFFSSLAARWNAFTPPALALDKQAIRAYAEETVVVGLYRMQSKMFRYWGSPQIGAVGRVTYVLRDRKNEAMLRTLHLLADFAFYSGAGYKTTMGMGQVRRVVG